MTSTRAFLVLHHPDAAAVVEGEDDRFADGGFAGEDGDLWSLPRSWAWRAEVRRTKGSVLPAVYTIRWSRSLDP